MRALNFITGHMVYNLTYNFKNLTDDNHHRFIAKELEMYLGGNGILTHIILAIGSVHSITFNFILLLRFLFKKYFTPLLT